MMIAIETAVGRSSLRYPGRDWKTLSAQREKTFLPKTEMYGGWTSPASTPISSRHPRTTPEAGRGVPMASGIHMYRNVLRTSNSVRCVCDELYLPGKSG